jgi:hypothetical protein
VTGVANPKMYQVTSSHQEIFGTANDSIHITGHSINTGTGVITVNFITNDFGSGNDTNMFLQGNAAG